MLPSVNFPGRSYITSFDPSTGFHLGTFIADDEAEIAAKIKRAAIAQKSWKKTTLRQRRRVVRSLLKWLVDNQDACARVACRDTGKTCKCFLIDLRARFLTVLLPLVIDAALGEILTTCSKMEWLINHGEKAIRPETRPSNFMMFYKKSQVIYEPLGVVSAIVSWNYRTLAFSSPRFREGLTINLDLLNQHCIMPGRPSLLQFLQEMGLCSNARNMLFGRQPGLLE